VVKPRAGTVEHSHLPSRFAFLAGSAMSPASADKAPLLLQAGQCGQEHRAAASDWHAVSGPTEALDSPTLFAALHQAFCRQDIMSFSWFFQTGREGLCKPFRVQANIYACVVFINAGGCVLLVVLSTRYRHANGLACCMCVSNDAGCCGHFDQHSY